MPTKRTVLFMLLALLIVMALTACGGGAAPAEPAASSGDTAPATEEQPAATAVEPVTITVWDYYGESSPIVPIVAAFESANPDVKVEVQSLDWDTMLEKMNVVLTGGEVPDVVTLDMTWLPTYAPLGAFADLSPMANGKLNGVPLDEAYAAGALEAMRYDDQILAMLYDFDVYALYYRADLLDEMGLDVPTTWAELSDVAGQLAANGKGQYAFMADTFHAAQFLYENGASILNEDNTAAAFNSPEAVEAIAFYAGMVQDGSAYYWSTDEGWEVTPGLKDGRIAMFSDGAYYMGIMKDAAPEMAGQWRVAPHPAGAAGPGSYMGGTGLAIPAKSDNQEAAWRFIEYAMTLENQTGVFENAGAAPALLAALESDAVNAADPYFGDQQTLSVFLQAMETATPFPYVRQWNDIDAAFTVAMEQVALGEPVQDSLDAAAVEVDALLSK